jgi:lysozyme
MALQPPSKRVAAATALATAIAIPAEGLRQWAYYDPPGVLTVCYGSTTNVQLHKKYSLAECKLRLTTDMRTAIAAVDECVPGLPADVLAAFGDAVYNLGPKIACDPHTSTAARMLKAGDIPAACKQILRWDKAKVAGVMVALPGLTTRRQREFSVCSNYAQDTI